MDHGVADRIESKLDRALEGLVTRDELAVRDRAIDARLGRMETLLDSAVPRLAVAESKNLARTERKGWVIPSVATIGATLLNAALTAMTWFVTRPPHGGG